MAASLKQDYEKIIRAGAQLVMISPDSREQHRDYALTLFGAELPYLFVSDVTWEVARSYGLIRAKEHPHGGYYYRSLWVVNRSGRIEYKSVPWEGNARVEEYQKLFKLIGSEPGAWRATCGLASPDAIHQ